MKASGQTRILVMLRALQRDPRYWGERADEFDPDRFLPEAVAARHPNAYHPFGLGRRSKRYWSTASIRCDCATRTR